MKTDIGVRFDGMKAKLLVLMLVLGLLPARGVDRSHNFLFEVEGEKMSGLLIAPARQAPHPVIVFMPGDGPFDKEIFFDDRATNNLMGAYREMGNWHHFLEMGYACFAWDTPGIGGSEGDWREDNLFDRQRQLTAALAALRSRDDIDSSRIGLWGAAEAGRVLPAVAARNPDLAFMIAVGCPGGTMVEQSALLLEQDLLEDGADKDRAAKAREIFVRKWEMTRAGVPYVALTKYVSGEIKLLGGVEHDWLQPWTVEEYRKLSNDRDEVEALFYSPKQHLQQLKTPVLAVFGDMDADSNSAADAEAYRMAFAKGENHRALVRTFSNAGNLLRGTNPAVVTDYWTGMKEFLHSQVLEGQRVKPGLVRRFTIGDGKLEVVLNLHDEKVRSYEMNLTSLIRKAYAHIAKLMGGPPLDAEAKPIVELVIDVRSGRLSGEADPGRLELTLGEEKVFGFLDWRALVIHEMFHLWNAETFRYVDYREQWFNEGATEYLTFKALMKLGFVAREQGPLLLARAWGNYNSARGIGEISLREAGHQERKKGHYFLVYHGGVTACMIFDYEIRRLTENRYSFEDLMHHLYQNYNHTTHKYNALDLVKGLKAISGKDFTDFFRRYIHGTEIMPIGRYVTGMEVEAIRLSQSAKIPEPDRGILLGLFELND